MRHVIAGVVMLLYTATLAHAQAGTAALSGRIVDAQQAALPGVTVIVRNQESGLFRETTSGPDGSFFVGAMLPGVYQIEAALVGFRPYQRAEIRLAVGQTATLDVTLQVAGIEESVTVRAEAPVVDTTSAEIGGNINSDEFIQTPSMNRNFSSMLGLLPGVVTVTGGGVFHDTLSVGGQDPRNMWFSMDGSDNNDPGSGGGNGSQTRVGMEAVQEFVLLTGQFDAEFGMAIGGVVNAVSKQGTNQFHGSAFAFFQDHKLSARDYFTRAQGLEEAPIKQQQFGGTIGGPIRQDKAHFFVSVERVRYNQGHTVSVPGRPDLSSAESGIANNLNTFLRFDHQMTNAHTWGVRWLREDSPQDLKFADSRFPPLTRAAVGTEDDVDQTLVSSLSSVIGATKVNTFRASLTNEALICGNPPFRESFKSWTPDIQKSLPPTLRHVGYMDQQSPIASHTVKPAYVIEDVFSWYVPDKAGAHELKFGTMFRGVASRSETWSDMNGTFLFSHDLAFNAADPRTYPERLQVRVPNLSETNSEGHYINGFAQDKWKLNNRLTLSLGVRYDLELLRTPNQENPLFAGDPDGYPVDKNNVQPRFGLAYTPDGEGRSVLRAGMGLFYQQTILGVVTPTISSGRRSTSFIAQFPLDNIDPGPRSGRFPTDPFLVNGPVVNHAAVDALYPPGTTVQNAGTVRFDNPDRQGAYTRQYSGGYQTQLGSAGAISVDYIHSESRSQILLKDLNPPRRNTALATGIVTRTNPLVGAVGEFRSRVDTMVNEGWLDYNSLQLSATKRLGAGYSARLSYAYSKGRGNTPTGGTDVINSQYLDDLRLDTEIGPTDVDRPHILSISGSWDVPRTGGLKLSGVFQARSGTPFSLINTTFDADQNGLTANEYLPAGTYSGTGADAFTVEASGGRNGARGPNYVGVDLRAGYRFTLPGGRTLDAHVDFFNITDRANFMNPAGDQRLAASFLRLTRVVGATRTAQLNVRYGF